MTTVTHTRQLLQQLSMKNYTPPDVIMAEIVNLLVYVNRCQSLFMHDYLGVIRVLNLGYLSWRQRDTDNRHTSDLSENTNTRQGRPTDLNRHHFIIESTWLTYDLVHVSSARHLKKPWKISVLICQPNLGQNPEISATITMHICSYHLFWFLARNRRHKKRYL